jgi:transposase
MKAVSKKYIGCDAHSSTCTFCVIDEQGTVLESRTIVTNGRIIREYLKAISGHTILCIEECGLSLWLATILKETVNEIMICNPVANKQYKQAKTDRLDAYNLAMLLRGGFLRRVYHDGSDQERLRIMVSAHHDLISDSVRTKNRFKALFRQQGICLTGKSCYRDLSLIQKLSDVHAQFVAEKYLRTIAHHQSLIEEYEVKIRSFSSIKIFFSKINSKPICLKSFFLINN